MFPTPFRYNRLLNEFRSSGKQSVRPSVSVVGVSIAWDILMTRALGAYQHGAVSYSCMALKSFHF